MSEAMDQLTQVEASNSAPKIVDREKALKQKNPKGGFEAAEWTESSSIRGRTPDLNQEGLSPNQKNKMKKVTNEAHIYLAGQDIEAIKEELNTRETDMRTNEAILEQNNGNMQYDDGTESDNE